MENINLHSQHSFEKIRRFLLRKRKKDFIMYFAEYLDCYTKKDRRVIKQAYDKYRLFISLHNLNESRMPDADTIRLFAEFLQKTSRGTGAASTYGRFRKVVIAAFRDGILKENPSAGIKCCNGGDNLIKDVLSEEEIIRLTNTHYKEENQEIRKAFIFCLYTGMRFCDARDLKYGNIDYTNRLITFEQSKTKGSSSRSIVYIPIREDLLSIIEVHDKKKNESIFHLPSHPTCLKHLRKWTKEAQIYKHITWHCARHSFATNILKNGADIKVVAELLGHSGLKYIEKYTRAVDKMKVQAVSSLPPIG